MTELIEGIQTERPLEELRRNSEGVDMNSSIPLVDVLMTLLLKDRHLETRKKAYVKSVLHLLLDRGARPESFMKHLQDIVKIMDVPLLEKGLEKGLSVDAQDEAGYTLLMHLVMRHRNLYAMRDTLPAPFVQECTQTIEAVILALLNHDPPPDASLQLHTSHHFNGDTVLHILSYFAITPFLFQLLERIATPENINIENDKGFTPLMEYIDAREVQVGEDMVGYREVLDLFEAKGANFLVRSNTNQPKGPLSLAESSHIPELIQIVKEKVRRAQEQAQGAVVQRGVPPTIARRITDFLGGKRKTRKGRKGQKARTQKGRKSQKSQKRYK